MHAVRMAVRENRLADPNRISEDDYRRMIEDIGCGWVYEREDSSEPLWLTTTPGTRAERFYRIAGWQPAGLTDDGELRFKLARSM